MDLPVFNSSATQSQIAGLTSGVDPESHLSDYAPTTLIQTNPQDNFKLERYSNAFNANEAAKNRNFQYIMSSTAFQRGMKDLKAAGINPYAAYSNLSAASASTPSGSTASASSARSNTTSGEVLNNAIKVLGGIIGAGLIALL